MNASCSLDSGKALIVYERPTRRSTNVIVLAKTS
jgi:hypothetical protein